MALPGPIIKRQGDRLTIRLPARPHRGNEWTLAILFCLPFVGFGGLMVTSALNPDLWGGHGRVPVDHSLSAKIVGVIFGAIFILLAMPIVIRGLILRFGHSEIVLARGRIRSIEQAGFIFHTSSRSLATLTRLDIVKPPFDAKTAGEPPMNLEAYFSDAMPFTLALLYPADTLKPIARELLGAIPNHGGAQKVVFAGPPPLTRTRPDPAIVEPTRRKGELSRMSVEQSGGSTRVMISPYPWAVAVLPLGLALTIVFFVLRPTNHGWQPNPTSGFGLGGVDVIYCLALLIALAGLAVTLAMRTRYGFEANRDGLRTESQSPLRHKVRQWPAAQIDRLFIDVRTTQGKQGPQTTRRLMLVLKNGKQQRISAAHVLQNLDWLCETLSAGLQQAGVSAAWPNFSPSRPTLQGPPRGVGIFFTLFSSFFFIAGWTTAIKQDLLLRHAVPVQSTVMSIKAAVTSYRGGPEHNFTTWRYRYCVNGRWYESDNLFATDLTGTLEQGIRERFLANVTKGQSIPAWYEPGDPSKVFVVRERLFGPYFLIFLAMVFIAVGLSIALRPRRPKDAPADAPAPLDLMRRRVETLFWTLSGAAAIGHYLLPWPATLHLDFLIVAAIWLIVSIVLLNWWRSGIVEQAAAPSKAV
jgi:hypothetical protein